MNPQAKRGIKRNLTMFAFREKIFGRTREDLVAEINYSMAA